MADKRKIIFIETVEKLFEMVKYNEGKTIDFSIPEEALDFFEDYKKAKSESSQPFTEKGIIVMEALYKVDDWITATALGEMIGRNGRSVSGTMKKLIEDGYVEKREGKPASYRITEFGKEIEWNKD